MNKKELDMVNDSLCALRNHFEAKGEIFLVAYQWTGGDNMFGNVLSTTAKEGDYGRALLMWAGHLHDWVKHTYRNNDIKFD